MFGDNLLLEFEIIHQVLNISKKLEHLFDLESNFELKQSLFGVGPFVYDC